MDSEAQILLKNIATYFLSISAITTALIFIAKSIFNAIIKSGIEKFKMKLSKDVEEFKSELKIKEIERNITFSKLHEERVLVIKEIYQKSLKLQSSLFNLTQPSQGPEWHKNKELNDTAYKDLKDFIAYFNLNKILIDNEICMKIDNFVSHCHEIENSMLEAKSMSDSNLREMRDESVKIWIRQFDRYRKEVTIINTELIEEFRRLFGVI